MSPKITTFSWDRLSPALRAAYAIAGVICAVVLIGVGRNEHPWIMYPSAALFGWIALGMSAVIITQVDPVARTVTRESRLFGKIRVSCRSRFVKDFAAIGFQRHCDAESVDTVFVELRPHEGHFSRVAYWRSWRVAYFTVAGSGPSAEAEQMARELAYVTGLDIYGTSAEPNSPLRAAPPSPAIYLPAIRPRGNRFSKNDSNRG